MALAQLRNALPHDSCRSSFHQSHIPRSSGPRFDLALSSPANQHFTSHNSHLPTYTHSRTWSINSLPSARPNQTTSTAGIGDDAPLQPKPQVKRPRLPTLPTPTGDPAKPRRWHKSTLAPAPLPIQIPNPSQLQPQPQQSPLNDQPLPSPQQQTQHAPALADTLSHQILTATPTNHKVGGHQGSTISPNGGRASSSRAGGGGRGRDRGKGRSSSELELQPASAGDGKLRGRSQPAAQSRSRSEPRRAAAGRKTQAGRGEAAAARYGSTTVLVEEYNDEDDEHEDEDDEEMLLGLSEEEIERMVFARAGGGELANSSNSGGGNNNGDGDGDGVPVKGGTAVSTSAPTRQQRHEGQPPIGSSAKSVAAPTAAPIATEIVTASGLLPALSTQILAAVQSGAIPNDADHLASQLKALREGAVDVAGTYKSTTAVEGAADGCNGHNDGDVLSASVGAISALLSCNEELAVAILVNYPRYVKLPKEEAEVRLRFVSYQLGLDLVGAQEAVRQNPVLLLVPSDALRRKLTALSNATGLKMTQAADMVTLYMFPGL